MKQKIKIIILASLFVVGTLSYIFIFKHQPGDIVLCNKSITLETNRLDLADGTVIWAGNSHYCTVGEDGKLLWHVDVGGEYGTPIIKDEKGDYFILNGEKKYFAKTYMVGEILKDRKVGDIVMCENKNKNNYGELELEDGTIIDFDYSNYCRVNENGKLIQNIYIDDIDGSTKHEYEDETGQYFVLNGENIYIDDIIDASTEDGTPIHENELGEYFIHNGENVYIVDRD